MFLDEDAYYQIEEDGYIDISKKKANKPTTFKDKLQNAYSNRTSSFTYQGKIFYYIGKIKHFSFKTQKIPYRNYNVNE